MNWGDNMRIFGSEIILEILKDKYSREYYYTKDERTKREYLYKKGVYEYQFASVEKGRKNIKNYIKTNELKKVWCYEN